MNPLHLELGSGGAVRPAGIDLTHLRRTHQADTDRCADPRMHDGPELPQWEFRAVVACVSAEAGQAWPTSKRVNAATVAPASSRMALTVFLESVTDA